MIVNFFRSDSGVDQAIEISISYKLTAAPAGTVAMYGPTGLSLSSSVTPAAGVSYTFIGDSTGTTWSLYSSSYLALVLPGTYWTAVTPTGTSTNTFSLTSCPSGTYSAVTGFGASSSSVCSSCQSGYYSGSAWRMCQICGQVSLLKPANCFFSYFVIHGSCYNLAEAHGADAASC